VIYLTKRHQFIACEDLFRGTIDGASVYPREVLKEVLKVNAAAVILAHNHPSGIAEPSQADIEITKQLKKVLDLVEIKVLDHIIIAGGDATSFAERDSFRSASRRRIGPTDLRIPASVCGPADPSLDRRSFGATAH
jgi:DNA repair protein RadC